MMSLKEKYENELKEIEAKLDALKIYKDLQEHTDRWKIVRLMTPSVNKIVTGLDFNPACDCCPKAYINCFPYVVHKGIKIHACFRGSIAQPFMVIGKKDPINGIKTNKEWQSIAYLNALSKGMIDKIWEHIDKILDDTEDIVHDQPATHDFDGGWA